MLRGVLTGILGLAYAFIVWTAVFQLIQFAQIGIVGTAWILLLLPVVLPVVVFVAVLAVTRRRTLGVFLLVMLAGLGLSAVFWLDTLSYTLRNATTLLG
ncbi:hypothetical protein GCM10022383_00670 [Microbacterium soli]|uniref:Bacitracin resistance protein n=1 Tax=Microbacterium soli TaxID=446075 RepID=A0ABP7MLX7_9MICO